MLNKTFKKAFTIAEVLIVVGIIGLIAEMTIPPLVKSYEKQLLLTQLKSAYSVLSSGVKQIAAQNGCNDLRCTGVFECSTPTNAQACREEIGDKFSSYFNVAKNCHQNLNNECFSDQISENYNGTGARYDYYAKGLVRYKFVLANGTAVYINNSSGCTAGTSRNITGDMKIYCLPLLIDVNGPQKGPNNIGRDIFWFYVTDGRGPALYPMGGDDDSGWPKWDASDAYCRPEKVGGYTCAARIMAEGWQMNY